MNGIGGVDDDDDDDDESAVEQLHKPIKEKVLIIFNSIIIITHNLLNDSSISFVISKD